jgi:hypothetical protein
LEVAVRVCYLRERGGFSFLEGGHRVLAYAHARQSRLSYSDMSLVSSLHIARLNLRVRRSRTRRRERWRRAALRYGGPLSWHLRSLVLAGNKGTS